MVRSTAYFDTGRLAMIYTADHLDDARAVFLFRPEHEPSTTTTATPHGSRTCCATRSPGMAPRSTAGSTELDRTPAFYFDSITQLELTTWSRGRVTLVGDAGYCPGPAVGGSTSLAVLGAYVLAGELANAGGDHAAAFAAYERVMTEPVLRSRAFARRVARTLDPVIAVRGAGTRRRRSVDLAAAHPRLTRTVTRFNDKGVRLYDSMKVPAYPTVSTSVADTGCRPTSARSRAPNVT